MSTSLLSPRARRWSRASDGAAPAVDPAVDPGERWSARALWQGLSVAGTAALMLVLRVTHGGLYLTNDKRNQYVPVLSDIGRRLRAGDFPAIDPNLGSGGNYALDTQYGVFDPLHLGLAFLVSLVHDPFWVGWLLAVPFLLSIAWGTTALLQRLGQSGVWAAAAGVAAATSGWVFFQLATFWWPGVVGAAFLPWVWWAWVGEARVRRLVALALFTYLVVASGWPSAWMAYGMLSAGLLVEAVISGRRQRTFDWAAFGARVLAAGGGVVVGAVNVVAIMRASHWTTRDLGVQNTYQHVVNWADAASFAVPYLHGDLASHGSSPTFDLPIFFFGWFLLTLLWATSWRAVIWEQRGAITAGIALGLAMLSIELPSDLGPIRLPSRQLAAVQFFAVVFVVLAWRKSPARLTSRRVVGILCTYAAMVFIAWSRTPQDAHVAVGAAAGLVAIGILLLAWHVRGLAWAGAWALLATLGLTWVAMDLQYPHDPAHTTVHRTDISMRAGEAPGLLLLPMRNAPRSWLEEGVGPGFSSMNEQNRYAPGYSSVSQRYFDARLHIRTPSGKTDPEAIHALFTREPLTGRRWVDLLGYRVVVVHKSYARAFEHAAAGSWTEVDRSKDFVKFAPSASNGDAEPAPGGRVTAVMGDVDVTPTKVGDEQQEYHVAAPDGGRLVFRDLFWPGYVATLGGHPVPVTPFKQTLVSVTVPRGTDAELVVRFRPLSPKALGATLGGGALLLLLSVAVLTVGRRRQAPRPQVGPPVA